MNHQSTKTLIFILLWLLVTMGVGMARSEYYDRMKVGAKLFSENDLDAAERSFSTSRQIATNNTTQAALAEYNLGNVKLRKGEFEAAAQHFATALSHEDESVRADAYYNRGLSLHHQAKSLEDAEDLDKALLQATGSLDMFESSLELNAQSTDVKANLELAYEYREALLEKKKQQQQQQEQEQQDQEQNEENKEDEQQEKQEQNQDQNQDQNDQQNQEDSEQQQDDSEQQQNPEEGEENQQQQPGEEPNEEDGEENQSEPSEPEASEESKEQPANPQQAQQMTREEAMMMLDAMREQEANERSKFKIQYGTPSRNPIAKPY